MCVSVSKPLVIIFYIWGYCRWLQRCAQVIKHMKTRYVWWYNKVKWITYLTSMYQSFLKNAIYTQIMTLHQSNYLLWDTKFMQYLYHVLSNTFVDIKYLPGNFNLSLGIHFQLETVARWYNSFQITYYLSPCIIITAINNIMKHSGRWSTLFWCLGAVVGIKVCITLLSNLHKPIEYITRLYLPAVKQCTW